MSARPDARGTLARILVTGGLALSLAACSGGGSSDRSGGADGGDVVASGSRDYRAVAGMADGAYSAVNLGTKHPDMFALVCGLGGPLDLELLLGDVPIPSTWLEEDPLTRMAARDAQTARTQRFYLDAPSDGTGELAAHLDSMLGVLEGHGFPVDQRDGLEGSCAAVPALGQLATAVRYVGADGSDGPAVTADLLLESACGDALTWKRLVMLLGAVEQSFPAGHYGASPDHAYGDVVESLVRSPSLGAAQPLRTVLVYRPPAYFDTDLRFPILYLFAGDEQTPADFERMASLLDAVIAAGEVQNLFVAVLPGNDGQAGALAPDVADIAVASSGVYETSVIVDLMPVIEHQLLAGRVR